MRLRETFACLGVAACLSPSLAQAPLYPAELEATLGAAGLEPTSARFDPGTLGMFGGQSFRTPLFALLHGDPWGQPEVMAAQKAALAGSPSLEGKLSLMGRWLGLGTRRSLLGDPIAAETTLAKDPAQLARLTGGADLSAVPQAVREAATLVLLVAERTRAVREEAFRGLDRAATWSILESLDESGNAAAFLADRDLERQVRMHLLFAAGQDLAAAAERARDWAAAAPIDAEFEVRFATPLGKVALLGGGRHSTTDEALVIDLAGDDHHLGPGTSVHQDWAVLVDLSGDDRYGEGASEWVRDESRRAAGREPGPGAARMGIALLLDSAGDDLYRSARPGFGSASFGVAALWDGAGNDTYDSYLDAQGYARFGLGLLHDLSGDDAYSGFTQVQAVGLTAGAGVLLDGAGNDRYVAHASPTDFPSPQSAQHNVSMAQGAGYGLRDDFGLGMSLSGGIGMLIDLAGDDAYSGAVFAQGVGYWEGVGALLDVSGRDLYEAQWYAQGASAHFGVGYLEDEGGDDRYTAGMNMAQGAGHDFGTGVLVDRAGNDRYQAPNLSLGSGNANGIGWLLEFGGDDAYAASGLTLGAASREADGSLRAIRLTLGVFMDLAGSDTYPQGVETQASNRLIRWARQNPRPVDSQVGIFCDK